MDDTILEVTGCEGVGYRPLIDFNGWRVATLCYLDELYPPKIFTMERHFGTDEVFVLLAGEATLILGGNGAAVAAPEAVRMEPLKLFNVKRSAWHGVVMSRDAVLLIIENADTCSENSELCLLTPELRSYICDQARRIKDWTDLP